MPDAQFVREHGEYSITAANAVSVGEVWQLQDGRAAVYPGGTDGRTAGSASSRAIFETVGTWTFPLTSSIVILAGGRVYWDHSAGAAHFKKINDRDFYLGRATADTSGGTVTVDLNVDPPYDIDLMRDAYLTVPVGTQALGGFLPPQRAGGSLLFILTSTNEAQKLDALSVEGWAEEANAIVEFAFRVPSDGGGTVVDVSVGIANDTHADNADTITESVFMHLDANNTAINFESDDGTTEVAATDSTKTYTEGSGLTVRKEVWFDMRDPADVQIYVDGVLILPSTVFDVDAGTGPWRLLVHIEKTASTDTYQFSLDWHRVRFMEQ